MHRACLSIASGWSDSVEPLQCRGERPRKVHFVRCPASYRQPVCHGESTGPSVEVPHEIIGLCWLSRCWRLLPWIEEHATGRVRPVPSEGNSVNGSLGVSNLTGVWTTGSGEVAEVKVSGDGNSMTGISSAQSTGEVRPCPRGLLCQQCPGESDYRPRKHHV